MKVKRMGITEILRRIWLFSANKIKSSESFDKQPTQLIIKLNSSLRHIIVTQGCPRTLLESPKYPLFAYPTTDSNLTSLGFQLHCGTWEKNNEYSNCSSFLAQCDFFWQPALWVGCSTELRADTLNTSSMLRLLGQSWTKMSPCKLRLVRLARWRAAAAPLPRWKSRETAAAALARLSYDRGACRRRHSAVAAAAWPLLSSCLGPIWLSATRLSPVNFVKDPNASL